jgi:hypothetical protein
MAAVVGAATASVGAPRADPPVVTSAAAAKAAGAPARFSVNNPFAADAVAAETPGFDEPESAAGVSDAELGDLTLALSVKKSALDAARAELARLRDAEQAAAQGVFVCVFASFDCLRNVYRPRSAPATATLRAQNDGMRRLLTEVQGCLQRWERPKLGSSDA